MICFKLFQMPMLLLQYKCATQQVMNRCSVAGYTKKLCVIKILVLNFFKCPCPKTIKPIVKLWAL